MAAMLEEGIERAVAGVEEIRARFPALERREKGVPVAYFDGPGGTQVPRSVVDAVTGYLLHHNANTRWAYPTSAETDAALDAARAALADLVGGSPAEVAFGSNMTTLTYHVSRALGRGWGAADEVVVTELDHQANVAPWKALERERDVRVHTVPLLPATGTLDLDALAAVLGPRTRLLALGGASNVLGTVNDVPHAVRLARAHGALVYVDGVHQVAHEEVDVRALGCDFFACSVYKFYGPHVGVLWGRRELLDGLDVPRLPPAPDTSPERIETGTLNHEGIVGAGAAVDFLASLAPEGDRRERLQSTLAELGRRGETLVARMWNGLAEIPGVRLFGPPPGAPRTPTVAFTVAGAPSARVAARLAGDHAVFVSHGDFYVPTVTERLGVAAEGLVRAVCACYTTEEEVVRLVAGVAAISARSGS